MIRQSAGKIFLAEQRGWQETPLFRRHSTFSFGTYAEGHKEPFGPLRALNEETLAGTHSLTLPVGESTHLLILPITGAVQVSSSVTEAVIVQVEEIQLLTLPAGSTLEFTNPYETELISFLHLWLQAEPGTNDVSSRSFAFDAASIENQLVEIIPAGKPAMPARKLPFALRLGRFAGRREVVHPLPDHTQCFAFVIAGAFELEGRLLHEKDGLALWETAEMELEALSNNALILVLDLSFTPDEMP